MKKRVLIIDDEQPQLSAMQRDLRELSGELEVHTSTKSIHTLKLIKELNIDLLITDIVMPEKEGLEIIREVIKEFPVVKIIAMTGKGVNYLVHAEYFGSVYSLSKPFSKAELTTAIISTFD